MFRVRAQGAICHIDDNPWRLIGKPGGNFCLSTPETENALSEARKVVFEQYDGAMQVRAP